MRRAIIILSASLLAGCATSHQKDARLTPVQRSDFIRLALGQCGYHHDKKRAIECALSEDGTQVTVEIPTLIEPNDEMWWVITFDSLTGAIVSRGEKGWTRAVLY